MASDRAIGRYRRWYARLLRLYPRSFHDRFGEPMEQTFTDLCRERTDANGGLHAFALRTFTETFAGIIRENMRQLMQTKNVVRWVVITAALLAIPLLAMVFKLGVPDPGSGTDGVNWGPFDFVIAGVLILGAGLTYEWASSRVGTGPQRIAVAIAVGAALLLIWVNLAVGMIGDEGNPANLMYLGVLAVLLIGAAIARLEPSRMAVAMFATAAGHAVVAVIALVAGPGSTPPADAFFIGLWVVSGLLFRQASVTGPQEATSNSPNQ